MGTWGPKIFQDDLAEDVRNYYKDQLRRGKKGTNITQELILNYHSSLADPENAPVFWFALADTQWDLGRLEENVKNQALKHLQDGDDLKRWSADQKSFLKRLQVLDALQRKLLSDQPPEKRIAPYRLYHCNWKLGDVYAFQLSGDYAKEKEMGGKYVFFVKIDEEIWHPGHTIPVVYFYWIVSNRVLSIDELKTRDYIPQFFVPEAYKREPQRSTKYSVSFLSTSSKIIPKNQLTYIGNIGQLKRIMKEDPNPYAVSWKDFEKYIIDNFQIWNEFSPHY